MRSLTRCLCLLLLAPLSAAADDFSPAELRYLAIEAELALYQDARTESHSFHIRPHGNALVVTGSVPDDATRALAERLVRRATRDYDVELINRIRVEIVEAEASPAGTPTSIDEAQLQEVREQIDAQFPHLADHIDFTFDLRPMPTIVLEGLVPSYEQKLEISRFLRSRAKKLPVLNNLRVRRQFDSEKVFYIVNAEEPAGRVADRRAAGDTPRELPPDDLALAQQIGATLKADPVIRNCQIEVRSSDGVVWLSGRVESMGQKIRAIKLASSQPGVRYVVNQLVIKPPSDEPSTVTVRGPEPDDMVFYLKRYLNTRVSGYENAQVELVDGAAVIVPAEDLVVTASEADELKSRLSKLPELQGLKIIIEADNVEPRQPSERAPRDDPERGR